MKWRTPQDGDLRIVKRFALFTIEIKYDDIRWLEYFYVKQEYMDSLIYPKGWYDGPFVEEEEYLEYIGKTEKDDILPKIKMTAAMPKCKRPPTVKGNCGGK